MKHLEILLIVYDHVLWFPVLLLEPTCCRHIPVFSLLCSNTLVKCV